MICDKKLSFCHSAGFASAFLPWSPSTRMTTVSKTLLQKLSGSLGFLDGTRGPSPPESSECVTWAVAPSILSAGTRRATWSCALRLGIWEKSDAKSNKQSQRLIVKGFYYQWQHSKSFKGPLTTVECGPKVPEWSTTWRGHPSKKVTPLDWVHLHKGFHPAVDCCSTSLSNGQL